MVPLLAILVPTAFPTYPTADKFPGEPVNAVIVVGTLITVFVAAKLILCATAVEEVADNNVSPAVPVPETLPIPIVPFD
jgi:hypothetical protein